MATLNIVLRAVFILNIHARDGTNDLSCLLLFSPVA